MAYPVSLRREVVDLVAQGLPKRQVASQYNLKYPTVLNWCKRAEEGEFAPRTPGPKKLFPRSTQAFTPRLGQPA